MSERVNILLVHGAWADGSPWSRVIPILQRAGHHVVAVQNQLASLRGDIKNTRRARDALDGPTLIVGHSYGGAVVSGAATGTTNVIGLVYLAALALEEGESLGGIVGRFPPLEVWSHVRGDSAGMLTIDPDAFPAHVAGDVDLVTARVLAATRRPFAVAINDEKVGAPAWRRYRSWYLVAEDDRILHPDAQRFMAAHAHATTTALRSSHAVLVSHPSETADLILHAAGTGIALA